MNNIFLYGITAAFCIGCILFGVIHFASFYRKFGKFRKVLREPESINDANPLFNLLSDYKRSFDSNGKTSEYAGDYINLDSVTSAYKIRLKVFSSIPNILTSIGILGTFLGLAFALAFFNQDDSEAIRQSINTLLSGMSTAFLTSIFGMISSMVFLYYEKKLINISESEIDGFCSDLDYEHHVSSEKVMIGAFTTKDEDDFDVLPGEAIAKMSSSIKSMKTTLDQFGTDLTDSIGNAMDKSFEEKLLPIINNLATKLENPAQVLTDSLVTELKEVCKNLENNLTKGINEQMNELLQRFITASESIKNIPDVLTEVNGLIKNSSSDTIKASMEVAKALDEQIIRLSDLSDAFAQNIEKATESASKLDSVNESLAVIPDTIREVSGVITSASSGLESSNAAMGEALGYVKESNDITSFSIRKYTEEINSIQEGLKGIFAQVQQGLSKYSEATRSGIQDMLDPFTSSLTEATTRISNTIAPLNDSVNDLDKFGDTVKTAISGLSEALAPLEESIKQLYEVRNKIVADVVNEAKNA